VRAELGFIKPYYVSSPAQQPSPKGEAGKNSQGQEEAKKRRKLLHTASAKEEVPGERQEPKPLLAAGKVQQEWEARERKRKQREQ